MAGTRRVVNDPIASRLLNWVRGVTADGKITDFGDAGLPGGARAEGCLPEALNAAARFCFTIDT